MKREYKLFDKTYSLVKKRNLKKYYFNKQLESKYSDSAIITEEHLKILSSDTTLFGKKIQKKDFLLVGIIIYDYSSDNKLLYTIFYITKKELPKLYKKRYYVTSSEQGIPKVISSTLLEKILKKKEK